MVIRRLANISKISEISFNWKWLTLILLVMSIMQLSSRKDAWYGFNVPNRYVTPKQKCEHDKNIFC